MKNIKLIRYNTVPCWYELSWREGQVILRIHQDFVNNSGPIKADAPIVEDFVKEFGFAKFNGGFDANFGFEDSLQFLGVSGEFAEFLIPTPLIGKPDGKCSKCGGSGKDKETWQEKCLYCEGEGVDIRYDYAEAYAISSSLTVLFAYLIYPKFDTRCSLPQLMTIRTITIKDMHGGSIGGEYSREAVDWMRRHGPGEIPEMVLAMQSAWTKMDGKLKDYYKHSFRAWLGDSIGWLCTGCPGDACGLHPEHSAGSCTARGEGYEFSCHNTDTPMQQLTLLASLAALHDSMRAEAR